MPRLFDTTAVDADHVTTVVASHWHSFELGERVKESQNHTFRALNKSTGQPVMIRVTPNTASAQRIKDELHLVRYLIAKDLKHICAPIPVSARAGSADLNDDDFVVLEGPLVIVAFEFASGDPVNFADWLWIGDEKFARSWGHWSGLLHNMTRQYAADHPDRAANFRNWDQLHDSILANAPLDPQDAASVSDPSKFGVLHGDLNISNFFWRANGAEATYGEMWVFDWDQTQRGWFMWDLSSVLFFPYMLSRAGTWMDGSAVPGIEAYDKFTEYVVQGYEDAAQTKIDLPALHRMVQLRLVFYDRFCHRALDEFNQDPAYGQLYAGMRYFMQWSADFCDKQKALTAGQ